MLNHTEVIRGKIPASFAIMKPTRVRDDMITLRLIRQLITCERCSGTVMVQTIDLSIGFDVIRYVNPFSANLVSKFPTKKFKKVSATRYKSTYKVLQQKRGMTPDLQLTPTPQL